MVRSERGGAGGAEVTGRAALLAAAGLEEEGEARVRFRCELCGANHAALDGHAIDCPRVLGVCLHELGTYRRDCAACRSEDAAFAATGNAWRACNAEQQQRIVAKHGVGPCSVRAGAVRGPHRAVMVARVTREGLTVGGGR